MWQRSLLQGSLVIIYYCYFGQDLENAFVRVNKYVIGTDLGNSLEAFAMYRLGQGSKNKKINYKTLKAE